MIDLINRLSIQTRFLLGSTLTLISFTAFMIVFYLQWQKEEQVVLLKDKVADITHIFSYVIGEELETTDYVGISNSIEFGKDYKDLNYLIVLDEEGFNLTNYNPDSLYTGNVFSTDTIFEANGMIQVQDSVQYNGVYYGTILLGFSTKKAYDNIREDRKIIIIVTIIVLILGSVFSLLISRNIAQQQVKLYDTVNDLRITHRELRASEKKSKEAHEELEVVHKDLEESLSKLKVAKKDAEEANMAKTRFLGNMSHEIRSPLNAIVGFSQVLVNQSKKLELPFNFLDNLGSIITSGKNLSELINNILDLSKIESGEMDVHIESINFKQLFQGIYHVYKSDARKKQLNFTYHLAPRFPVYILSDRSKLNTIMINLVSNAIKFTPEGKAIQMEVTKEDENIMIKVADEGIGIEEDILENIFGSFEQVDSSTTRNYGGTGLGLALAKKMVHMLDGEIWAESKIGEGSTFYAKVPLIIAKDQSDSYKDITLSDYCFSKENTILAVEDIELNQQVLQALFEELSLDIHFADNGEQGIQKVKELNPNLVLMDMHMPEMDGIEATKKIKKIPKFKELPIVALSADALLEQQNNAKEAGVSEYITKPIDFDKLLPVLTKYLKQDEVAKNIIKDKNLSDASKEQILQGLGEILKTPYTELEVIDLKIQELKSICSGYKTDFNSVLNQLEDILFSGETEEIGRYVEEVLNSTKE